MTSGIAFDIDSEPAPDLEVEAEPDPVVEIEIEVPEAELLLRAELGEVKTARAGLEAALDDARDTIANLLTEVADTEAAMCLCDTRANDNDVMRQAADAATAVQLARADDAERKLAAMTQDRDAARRHVSALVERIADASTRKVWAATPAHRQNQAKDTRLYVLADNLGDALTRLGAAGVNVETISNATRTEQVVVLGIDLSEPVRG